jgi:hypothetical protein
MRNLAISPMTSTTYHTFEAGFPLWDHDAKTIEGMPQCFADHLDPVQGPHNGQNVRGVSPLAPARLDQLTVAAP